MRTETEGFLARVREVPDDDGPRLIFADWLDEQGDSRGQFIRVQVALAKLPDLDRRRPELLRAQHDLLARFGEVWAAPFRGLATGPVFHRGFVEEVKVAARQFLGHGPALFAADPVRHLHLLDLGGHLGPVFSPLLARLTGLTVFAQHLGDPLARAVAECPHLAGLRALRLGRNRIGDAGAERLTGSPHLAALQDLDLAENELGEPAARALADCPRLAGLRRLELGRNTVGPAGAGAIAGSPHLRNLDVLGLAGNALGGPRLAVLPSAAAIGRVGVLDLRENRITAAGLRNILGAEQTGLRELDLSDNHSLGDAGAEVLAEAPAVAGLRVLRLSGTSISDVGLELLAGSRGLSRLVVLDVSNNQIGDDGFRAVLESWSLRNLRRLTTPGYGISARIRVALENKYNRDPVAAW
jgi:uncharacterized protein (TIGR02996 family)